MGYDGGSEWVEIDDVRVIRELERSIIIDYAREELIIPKSQISPKSKVEGEGDEGVLIIPRWLAEDRDMI